MCHVKNAPVRCFYFILRAGRESTSGVFEKPGTSLSSRKIDRGDRESVKKAAPENGQLLRLLGLRGANAREFVLVW